MTTTENLNLKIKKLSLLLENSTISEYVLSLFINNNINYFLDNKDNIYVVFNNTTPYCILYVNDNKYSWAIIEDNKIQEFQNSENDYDYIIDTIVNNYFNGKVQKLYPEINDLNLENKILYTKKLTMNTNGIHIK